MLPMRWKVWHLQCSRVKLLTAWSLRQMRTMLSLETNVFIIYRASCKTVYPTLRDNIQHFLSKKKPSKKYKYHTLMRLIFIVTSFSTNVVLKRNYWNLLIKGDLLITHFLENVIPTLNNLNKETKNKASMLKIDGSCYFHSSPGFGFRTLLSI